MEVVGGAFLSAPFELLFSKLDSFVSEWLNLPEKVCTEMQNWKSLLPQISALFEDAEEKQVSDRLVKLWLADLKDLFYDMEDILEEVEIDAKRFELSAEVQASTSKRRKLTFHNWFNNDRRFTVKEDSKMASRVEEITARLQRIEANVSKLNLVSSAMRIGDRSHRVTAERLPTTHLLEPHVYGRENDKKAILQILLSDEGRHEPYSVIPIIGMGGLGKTTLARLVYNDENLKGMFGLKAWVCISEEFDVSRITRSILEQVTRQKCDLVDLSSLQDKLKEKFSGQKFFLVLDDIWEKRYVLWDELRKPFLSGAFGSKIIITTRDKDIGKMMKGDDKVYSLKLLENDVCLSLFAYHALGVENFDTYPNLKGVGEKIVEKCKGLPLAIKTLSGLLRGELHLDEWEYILNNKIWDSPEDNSNILPALRLSYNHLPSHLKRCFGYCSIFPKDYLFDEDELVSLWMANGLLQQQPQRMKQTRDLGHRHFRDLLSRAFFQQSTIDKSLFVMHDLMVDLALHVAGDTCCTLELNGEISNVSFQRVRHLSFFSCEYEVSKRFKFLEKKKNLRTFLSLDFEDYYLISNTLLEDLMKDLKCLRVLSLMNYQITKLSDQIEHLKHLRFINLSGTQIESLPDSVGYLPYLQTLLLRCCDRFSKLPTTIGNLLDLQHLDIVGTSSLKEFPSEISNLTSLVTLSKFIIGDARGPRVKDLKNLSCLQGELSILDIQNVVHAKDAEEANLSEMKGLDNLSLEWSSDFLNNRNERSEMEVLRWLKPYQGLKSLQINCFGGLKFPPWMGDPSFYNLEFLMLYNCQKSTSLPSLQQLPQLKKLIITGIHAIQTMMLDEDSSSARAFPLLESLKLEDCPILEGNFPKCIPVLKKLEIVRCPKLIYSPISLPSLEELRVEKCSEAGLRSMVELKSLKTLRINRISKLIWLPKSFVESLIAIEDMEIKECDELTCLWEEGANMENLTCLKRMSIKKCPLLVSLKGKEQDFLPKNIQTLSIDDCEALESLPTEIMMMMQLEKLCINGCPALRIFPRGKLPTMLKILQIRRCEKLESLPEGILLNNGDACQVSHLEELTIDECLCLKSFPPGHLPNSFKCLSVSGCNQLEFIPQGMLQYCTEIKDIYIDDCDKHFPRGCEPYRGLHSLYRTNFGGLESFCLFIPNLKRLTINNCKNLKSLPEKLQDLDSLDELCISDCPGIESIRDGGLPPNITSLKISDCPGIQSIPDGGLPPKLGKLVINCKNLKKPMQEWGLSSLTSLLTFKIHWICPPNNVLPTSLTSLEVQHVENMKFIPRGLLQNLNSLQDLTIEYCPKLQTLPKEALPASLQQFFIWECDNFQSLPNKVLPRSLQHLQIGNCRNFQSLPEEGLPPSLEQLCIIGCPRLQRRCMEEKGDYWPLIAYIPYIELEDE